MTITCITVGKKHDPAYSQAIKLYEDRLIHYVSFSFEFIPISDKETESKVILKRVHENDVVILLDEKGLEVTNDKLTYNMENMRNQSVKNVIFVIGGPYGVNGKVKERSNFTFRLSGLVFPHQLVRLILVEQLYRTFNILGGGKYHHS